MYRWPIRLRYLMVAVTDFGSRRDASTSNRTSAHLSPTTEMSVICPIRTPDMRMSSPSLSPVASVNLAA
jgi:hypothetical protein